MVLVGKNQCGTFKARMVTTLAYFATSQKRKGPSKARPFSHELALFLESVSQVEAEDMSRTIRECSSNSGGACSG